MSLHPALARLGRGFRRMGALAVEWLWERPRAALAGVPWVRWRAQQVDAGETDAGLAHMLDVAAVDEPTDAERIGLIQMEEGYRLERAELLRRENEQGGELTPPQRRKLAAIDKALAELRLRRDGASPETLGPRRMAAFGQVGNGGGSFPRGGLLFAGANPLAGVLMSPALWVAAAFAIPAAWGSVTSWRLNHAKADLRETRESLQQAIEERDGWRERADQYAQAVSDAREVARQSAAALDAERARRARAAAVERRRQREIQDILRGSGDAPDWRLRNDTVSGGPGADD